MCFSFYFFVLLRADKQPSNCTYQGKTYKTGFFRPTPCKTCVCHSGRVTNCTTMKCLTPACSGGATPVTLQGHCCSTCPRANCTTVSWPLCDIPWSGPAIIGLEVEFIDSLIKFSDLSKSKFHSSIWWHSQTFSTPSNSSQRNSGQIKVKIYLIKFNMLGTQFEAA